MATFVGDSLMAHARAGCYTCLRGSDLVDTEVQIEGEGALVLCKACIADLAEAAGLTFNVARVHELEAALAAAHPERFAELETELEDTRVALADEQRLAARLQDALSRPRPTKAATSK